MSDQDDTSERPEAETRPEFGRSTRRTFLSRLGMAGLVATTAPALTRLGQHSAEGAEMISAEAKDAIPVKLRVNGKEHGLRIDPRTSLLDCVREHLHLTGSKKGCDHGQCGACTVLINGRRMNSCLIFAAMHEGDEITTIEGLGQPENLSPMQAAFLSHDAYQCGYCTSGQIMSATALLKEPCGPDDTDVKEYMSGNICRRGAYANIVSAIQSVRKNKEKPA
jgi:xanthine dehydrogenase YagT iron-sulfur-binding subunit